MGKILVNESSLSGIAAAIRSKNGESTTYKPGEMAQAILDIPTSGSAVIESKSITANGTYTASTGVDGYSPVVVDVQPNLQSKTATENGTVTPDSGYDGLSSVLVNVSGGSSTILHGDTTPTSSQGQNGDIYLKTYSSSLPSGMTQIEYIGSTGTQWINTGYLGKANSKYVADVYIETSQGYSPAVFGGRTYHVSKAATFFALDFFAGQWADQEVRSGNITSTYKGIRSTIEMDQSGYTVTNANGDSVSFPFTTSTPGGTDYSVALFGTTSGSTSAGELIAMKLYRFSIYEGNTLVHDYIPCRNAYNLAGLCDVVTGTLFTNGGSGNFSLGNDVSGGTHQYVSNAFLKRSGEWEPLIGADISDIL